MEEEIVWREKCKAVREVLVTVVITAFIFSLMYFVFLVF